MNPKSRLLTVLAAGGAIALTASYLYGAGGSSTSHAESHAIAIAQAPIAQGADTAARLTMRPDSPTGSAPVLPPPPSTAAAGSTNAGAAKPSPVGTAMPAPGAAGTAATPSEPPPAPALSSPRPAQPTATNGTAAASPAKNGVATPSGGAGAAQGGAAPPAKTQGNTSPGTAPQPAPQQAQPPSPPSTHLGTSGSMTIVPTPPPGTLSEIAKIQGEIQLAKAKADLKQVEVTIADLEKKLNPPNPLADLVAAGILPPGVVPNSRVPAAPVAAAPGAPPVAMPPLQALQAVLPIPVKTDDPPKLLMIRGRDIALDAVFEIADGPALPVAPGREPSPAAARQITAQQGDELPGKWVVLLISNSSVTLSQKGKTERVVLRPGEYLPVRYSEPERSNDKPPAKPTPLSPRPAAEKTTKKPETAQTPKAKSDAADRGTKPTAAKAAPAKAPPAKTTKKPAAADIENNG